MLDGYRTLSSRDADMRCGYDVWVLARLTCFLVVALASAERVKWTTSRVVGSPDPPPPYQLVRAFAPVTFKEPIFIAQEPGSERVWVGEYGGRIYSFLPSDPVGSKQLVLDINRGLSAFSFHPKYTSNGQIFTFSHDDPKDKREAKVSQVSRWAVDRAASLPRARADSQTVIVEWPGGGHNGGEAIIGPDGYLYIATGDSTGGSDLKATGQGVDDLLSVMMRLDVDHPEPGRAYSIPKDNPFVSTPGARPEIWAYGFRNPWRFSFDPVTGRPWVGDVGQDLWEMIELSSKGANHGWSVREGTHSFHPHKKAGPGPFVNPVVEHHHTECRSITGGYVYQGAKFPELRGAYLYGDYEYGKMWSLRYDYKAEKVAQHREIADTAVKISSFGLGRDGSFWALDYNSGEIFELARRPKGASHPPFPRKLSQTGLFASMKDHRIASGVFPYEINAPFWSDGAHKERFFALPGNATVEFKDSGAWQFDDGAVTMKSFWLELEQGNAASRKKIETRIVVKQDNHWVGYSYVWNDSETDATLVGALGMDRTYRIRDAAAPGGVRTQTWHYPSRNECMFCHSRAAGFALGLTTHQMNHGDQLRKIEQAGLFKQPLPKPPQELAAFPNPFDSKVEIGARVKTYLEVNCAMCHVADGGGNSPMLLGYKTPFAEGKIIGEKPVHDTLGIDRALLIAPGEPERSVIYSRITRRGTNQMPPTSSNRVDPEGAKLIEDWIRQLK
ncbi:MAG: PQQ-dependent sugar dehydrogenase [Bryobacteraceae bacterium]